MNARCWPGSRANRLDGAGAAVPDGAMRALFILLFLLAACGRPLTGPETELAARLFGDSLNPAPVRLYRNGFVGMTEHRYATRPRTTCRERLAPPATGPYETGRFAGVAFANRIHLRPDVHRRDFARNDQGGVTLAAAMFLAHELTHVWQWQNRARTGFTPWRAGAEHQPGVDPYLFDADSTPRFLDYPFEQQASLVEEYVCCAVLDPAGARTARLRALLAQEMAPEALPVGAVTLPWDGVERRGICG